MLEEFSLAGNVALVTSCGKSWIKELASALSDAGATVVVATSEQEKIDEVSRALKGKNVFCHLASLTDASEIEGLAALTVSRYGKVDILVNSLNLEVWKPMLEITEKDWSEVMQNNLTPAFLYSKAVGKYMVAQKAGSIVNIISGLAERGVPNGAAYCSSLGGVLQLTRALALEWAPQNVRVNAIGVGWTDKPLAGNEKDSMGRYIPSQRRARAGDVVPMVVFLASRASSYTSGCFYVVDGGLMARA
jgi:NAD(P)-dependent dehydrogenase (short-subunit alcohol dehydrogenase family)